jgi:hypothetical protein
MAFIFVTRRTQVEIWKPITGFDSYEVSNLGRLRRVLDGKLTLLKPEFHKQTGYLRANVWTKGKRKHRKLHRVVAEAFIPNPHNKPEVNHKNGDKKDCSVYNLEWATPSENILHAISLGSEYHHVYREQGKFAPRTED